MPFLHHKSDQIFYHAQTGTTRSKGLDAILFLHSLGVDHRLWQYQFEYFHSKVPMIIAPDARGHGRSSAHTDISLDLWVEDILRILNELALEKVLLCGISMGGIQAMAFARRHPQRLKGLVLADTFAKLDPETIPDKIQATAGVATEQGMDAYAHTYLEQTLSSSTAAQAIREELRQAISSMELSAYQASAEICFSADVESGLQDIRVPTLVLIGDDDLKTPLPYSQRIRDRIPGARLAAVPEARHLSNIDNPHGFNRLVWEYAEQVIR